MWFHLFLNVRRFSRALAIAGRGHEKGSECFAWSMGNSVCYSKFKRKSSFVLSSCVLKVENCNCGSYAHFFLGLSLMALSLLMVLS